MTDKQKHTNDHIQKLTDPEHQVNIARDEFKRCLNANKPLTTIQELMLAKWNQREISGKTSLMFTFKEGEIEKVNPDETCDDGVE